MTTHPDRTRHAYFCPKCRQDFEEPDPGKCEICRLTLVPSGYCPRCRGYWRLRVGQTCPEHDVPLEGEAAETAQELDEEARAVDPGLDAVVVYEGTAVDCALAHAALADSGVEAALDDSSADPLLPKSKAVNARVLVPRRSAEKALAVLREFEKEADESCA